MWRIFLETVLVLSLFSLASYHDLRSREVPDRLWVAAGAAAVLGNLYYAPDVPSALLASAGLTVLLLCTVTGLPDLLAVPLGTASVIAAVLCGYTAAAVPLAMFFVFIGMYRLGLIRGGADAKALIVIAMAFPVYPEAGCIPLLWSPVPYISAVINPSVAVLTLALVSSVAVSSVSTASANLRSGSAGRRMFSERTVPIEDAYGMFAWPVEDIREGEKVRIPPGAGDGGSLDRLAAAGETSVAVTPMIPFVAFLTVAAAVVLLLGNPLFALAA